MHLSRRLLVLLVILALAAVLVLFSPATGPSARVVEVRTEQRTPLASGISAGASTEMPSRRATEAPTTLLALRNRSGEELAPAAAFFTHDWTPPPPPPPPPPPAAAPQAPALPFTFIGKQRDETGEWIIFLADQERTYTVKANTLIESSYRVGKIAPPTLTLTYLPLQQQQTLAIGAAE